MNEESDGINESENNNSEVSPKNIKIYSLTFQFGDSLKMAHPN